MPSTVTGLTELIDPDRLIEVFGLIGVTLAVFAESGLLIGFFLPGDSLLFTAGVLSAAGKLSFPILLPTVFVAAVLGDGVGYAFGSRAGRSLYSRPDSRFFKKDHLERARAFYDQRGGSTIVLARFIPIVRTFAPIVAGAAGMPYRRFVVFNVMGALLWGVGVTSAGYILGNAIPDIDRYLLPIIAVIVLASISPMIWHALKVRRSRRESGPTRDRAGA